MQHADEASLENAEPLFHQHTPSTYAHSPKHCHCQISAWASNYDRGRVQALRAPRPDQGMPPAARTSQVVFPTETSPFWPGAGVLGQGMIYAAAPFQPDWRACLWAHAVAHRKASRRRRC